MKGKKQSPNLPARFFAWVLSIMLTMGISLTVLSYAGVQLLTSPSLANQVAENEKVLNAQKEKIDETINALAAQYGISPDVIHEAFSEEELVELNHEMSDWWSRMMMEGKSDNVPEWSSYGIQDVIQEYLSNQGIQEEAVFRDGVTISKKLEETVQESSLPVRGSLISRLFEYINQRIRWADTIQYLQKTPGVGLAACLLLAGLTVLLIGRTPRLIFKYFGSVLGGAGICIFVMILLIGSLKIGETISQASSILIEQYKAMTGGLRTGCLLAAGLMFVLGITGLYIYSFKFSDKMKNSGERL